MLNFYYKLEYGSFYLYADYVDRTEMVNMMDTIAMAYDPDTYTLLKHGNPTMVQEWVKKFESFGMKANIITFTKEHPIDEINKVLSTSGYLRYVLNESTNQHSVS